MDANVLIHATNSRAPAHQRANEWLAEQLSGPTRTVGIPWVNALAFLRIMTNPRLFEHPVRPDQAWAQLSGWFALPSCWIPSPGEGHAKLIEQLIGDVRPTGNLVSDMHLVALAREHGLTIASADSDFAKFPGIKWINPLTN